MVAYYNKYNHNEQGDPHPQYNRFNKLVTNMAPDTNDKLWVPIMSHTLRFSIEGETTDSGRDCLRRLGFSAYITDGTSEGPQELGMLYFYCYVSKNKTTPTCVLDYTAIAKDGSKGTPFDFRCYFKDTGKIDNKGVKIYNFTLYAKVYGGYARVTLQPITYDVVTANTGDSRWYNHHRSRIAPYTNSVEDDWSKIKALFKGMESAAFVAQADMEAAHTGELLVNTTFK